VNNKDSAFFYQDIAIAANDSLYSQEKLNQLRKLAVDEKLRQMKLVAAAEKRKRQLILFSIAGGVIVLLFIILMQFRIYSIRKKEKEKTAHVRRAAELELQSLRAQLNPHFMFNSLNAIQELILKEDFENSHTYLARFAKLLRMLLENAERPFIPLRHEIDFLELYLALENLRVPDLHYSITTDTLINTQETLIPNMILQPYIENALWHGLSPKQGSKELQLKIYKKNSAIVYDVRDNGIGRKKAAELRSLYRKEHKSRGMELLTKRFKLLSEEFGSDIKTEVTDVINSGQAAGTIVSIIVPNSISNLKYEP
jgi:LytS/YehU family sensor histidine kinase